MVHSLPETLPGTCQHMPGLGVRGCLESQQRRNQGPTEVRGLMEGASWERYRVRGIIGEVSREISWKRCDGGGFREEEYRRGILQEEYGRGIVEEEKSSKVAILPQSGEGHVTVEHAGAAGHRGTVVRGRA